MAFQCASTSPICAPQFDRRHTQTATDDAKRRKDVWQAESLIKVLSDHRPDDLRDAWKALSWKKQAKKGMKMLERTIKF